ncbi:hypothetical protein ScPMuIL_001566 [Solemya velum]
MVSAKKCKHVLPPNITMVETCLAQSCDQNTSKWITSQWTQCSVTCGVGIAIRNVQCGNIVTRETTSECKADRPEVTKLCYMEECSRQDTVCKDKYGWCHLVVKSSRCHDQKYTDICCQSCSDHG